MRTIRIFIFFCWLGATTAFGQEVCNNNVDDDGDGFIDCYDSNCANNSFCDGTFLGNDVSCQAQPSEFPTFSMKRDWFSRNKTAVHFGRLAIGDLDNDGIPEVVSFNTYDERLYILEGDDGDIRRSRNVASEYSRVFDHDIAIAHIDGDNCGDIFVMGRRNNSNQYVVARYDCNLNRIWRRNVGTVEPRSIALADFNGDGSVELYYKNEIRNAHNGDLLVDGVGDFDQMAKATVAVDLHGDSDLELVEGGNIYDIDLGAGTATLIASMPGYNVKGDFSSSSVADYNQDGLLDIIATGGDDAGITTVFFWSLSPDSTVLTYSDAFGNGDYQNGWDRGTGRVNIADINGDGRLNATYVSGEYLYALDDNMNQTWRSQINEQSSGFTGCTLFDFNGDGVSEVVYRDERWLYIINGKNGTQYPGAAVPCISRTFIEYPIVADVDGDGATELCVTCGFNDQNAWTNFWDNPYSENSHVRVFESAGEPWVPARRLWNQHAYFNVNINDDLTIPRIQQKHHLTFSVGNCTSGPNRPLNSFLNQSPYMDSNGCPVYASPDLAFVVNSLSVQEPDCPEMDFLVSFEIENLGDIELNGDLPITFYEGDPNTATTDKLNTETVTVNNLVPGATMAINDLTVHGTGGSFVLYIVLNDDGTTIPLSLPNTDFFECDYGNNILSADIEPIPFSLSTETTDNTVCDVNLTGNGSARAYRLVGTIEETADYTFYWYNGNAVGTTPDFTGPVYSNLSDGEYTVYALHSTVGCSSDTVTVTVGLTPGAVTAAIILQNPYTNCNNPNGHLQAEVNGGAPVGLFNFAWYQGDNIFTSPLIGTSHNIINLGPGQYTLLVTEKSTGCETIETYTIIDDSVPPVVTASADDASCPNPTSGRVTAQVTGGNGGHSFAWYIGTTVKPTPDYTTRVVNNLPPGDYTVVATKNSDQCSSSPMTVTVDIPSDPVVTANMVAVQTSCDTGNPNGAATAHVGGVTAGYTFTWYQGQGTTGTVAGSTANVNGLSAGPYTVEVVNDATGCSSTEEVTVTETLTYPTVAVNVDSDQTDCAPPNGQLSANVGGATTGFTFLWYNGNIGTPDLNNPDATGITYSGLIAGEYTVVAVNNNTQCPSARVVTTITDNTVIPTIAINVTDQTSCDAASPNGELAASVGGTTTGYTFTWHRGAGTAGTVVANTATATGLAAGVYTVEAVNAATGCSNTSQTTLNNNLTYPVVTPVVDFNQNHCVPSNGQLSASVAGTTTGFTFLWYDGNVGTPDLSNPDATGIIYSGLTAGDYTVVAVNNNTQCPSAPVVATVNDITALPTIAINVTDQTSCDAASPNGELAASVGGTTTGYTFTWHRGAGTAGTVVANTATATGLAAGVYTVEAVNAATGCSNTSQTTLNNNLTYPVVTPVVDFNQNHCVPSNGQLSASVAGTTTGFTFLWYDGNVGTPDLSNPDATGITYAGLTAGDYTVVAVNNNTQCPSAPEVATVNDITVLPTIAINVTDQTSCDAASPNGELAASVGGTTIGYTFTWYQGAGTAGTVVANTPTASGLAAGVYTLDVVNDVTGCSNTSQTTLNNNLTYPVVTPIVDSHQNRCIPSNGQLSASVAGTTTGFTFLWYDGNVGTPDLSNPDATGITYAGLTAGDYTVVAVNDNTQCPSTPVVATINDNTVIPNLVANKTDNTACDPALYNGTISAGIGTVGTVAGHTFHIFSGQTTVPANEVPGSPSDHLSGLTAGIYTIQAINNATGCSNTIEVTVDNNIVQPVISLLGTDVMSCSPFDGSITASVNVGNIADYTFSWYDGGAVKAATDYSTTGNVLSGLDAGTYTVNAYNNVLGCLAQTPQTITINRDPGTIITITELASELTIPSSCNMAGGQLGVQASAPGNTSGFTFTWYEGDPNTNMTLLGNGTDFPVNSNRLGSLESGRYTVIALDNDTGCEDTLSIDLPYAGAPTLLSITIQNDNNCTVGNGSFTVEVDPSAAALALGADESWFEVQVWKDGIMDQSQVGANPHNVFAGLDPGNYTVIAVETHPSLSGCTTTQNATIASTSVPPAITTNAISDNRNCSGATGTGLISLSIDGVATPASGYDYNWYQGQTTSDPALPAGNITAPGHTVINLTGGYYTVEVIDNTDPNNTCSSVATFFIHNDPYIIGINSGDINLTHQTNCAPPFLGNATVTEIYIDGVANGGTAGFTFEWFESDGITPVSGAGTGDALAVNVNAGDYFVRATNTTSNCMSSLVAFEILDHTVDPNVVMVLGAPNTICDMVNFSPNGQLSASVTEGMTTGVTAGYTFDWFTGQNNTDPTDALPAGNITGVNGQIAQNLAPGFYTVRVTDNTDPNNTCETMATMQVPNTPDIVNILTADIAIDDQDDCSPVNGSATVTQVMVNGIGQVPGGFSFNWYESDASTAVSGASNGPNVGVALAAGTYFVQATSTSTGCATSLVPFEIQDLTQVPVVVKTLDAPNTVCDMVNFSPNGQLSASITEGMTTGMTAGYTFDWFTGQNNTDPADALPAGNITGGNGEIAQNLTPGFYTVRVTDNVNPNNSCQTIATMEVPDIPDIVNILTADIAIDDQDDCSPVNGSATVTQVMVNGIGQVPGGFSFNWYESDASTAVSGASNGPNVGVALAAGTYFVQATSTSTGCATSLVPFEILDHTVDPNVVMVLGAPNTICDMVNFSPNGQLSASVTEGMTTGVTAGYTFDWFTGQNNTDSGDALPAGNITGVNGQIAQNLAPGFYTVRVTDNLNPNNSCQTIATMEVPDIPDIVNILTADIAIDDQDDCSPVNGSATVTQVMVNGIGQVPGGFSFNWYESDASTAVSGASNGPNVGVALAAGTYFVQATSTSTGCATSLVPFEIQDLTQVPVVVKTLDAPNTVCDMVNFSPNGQLSASITEGMTTGMTAGYTFDWFTGQNNTDPADALPAGNITGGNGEIAQNLTPGFYTVRVTDNVNPNNSCQTIATMEVPDMPEMVTIATADLILNDQSNCTPINGSATVNQVMVNGIGQVPGGFSFNWYESDASTAVSGASNGPNAGVALAAGTYFVQAISNSTGCATSLVQFEIMDLTALPVITLVSFTNPTVCDQPNVLGELSVTADGSTNTTDYTFTWYEGTDASGTLIPGNNPVINNITAGGNYYLEVTNNTTGCMSSAQYTLLTEIQDILLSANATDVTNCVNPDGTLFATVTSGNSNNYDYFWYIGSSVTSTPDYTGKNVTGLDMGDYTIVAVDQADPSCTSVPITLTIGDGRMYPELELVPVNPVTNCDASRPNGAAIATANGTDIGFTFDWFVGTGISGSPFYTGSQANGLSAITYTVLATDITTGCTTIEQITIDENFDEMPLPDPEVISHQTSCTTGNGEMAVSVDGNTVDYIFTWYSGQDTSGPAVYTGDLFTGPDPGFYTVTATDIGSGCVSEGVTIELLEELIYPEFDFVVKNADCGENNGSIKLDLTSQVILQSIEWNTPNGAVFGPNLIGYPAGEYEVTVTTDLGCTTTKSVAILPNITPYNGISFNGDGQNDFFVVSCLELYPNNKVKIFNRAGTLVFETDGYNNLDNIFDGTANKGISVLGSKLPSGTYFYVIDKMDNSEAVSGYLELLND